MSEGKAVRITDDAHELLTEKAEDYNITQKEIASEAILTLFRNKRKIKACNERLEEYSGRIIRLRREIRDTNRYALGTFLIGAAVSGCVIFFVRWLL